MADRKKRGQAWGLDLMVAMIIFSAGVLYFFLYSINYSADTGEKYQEMKVEAEYLANSILNECVNDCSISYERFDGILSNGKINQTKLEDFNDLTANYPRLKNTLDSKYDFLFSLSKEIILNGEVISGIGKPNTDPTSIEASNLIKVTRFSIYGEEPINVFIYVWEE